MRIQEAATRLGISARMLRHYENEGLIVPRRAANGYRSYTTDDLLQAEWARDLIACGFSARELCELVSALEDSSQQPGLNCSLVMRGKLNQIDRLVETLKSRRAALSARLGAWERGVDVRDGRMSFLARHKDRSMTAEQTTDRSAIRELCDLYHAAVNFRDWSLLADIFAPDATWFGMPPIDLRFEGISAIIEGVRASVERQEILVQTSSGLVIDLHDTDAGSVKSTLLEFGREPGKDGWSAVAVFNDRVIKLDGMWRFAARTVHLHHLGTLPISGM